MSHRSYYCLNWLSSQGINSFKGDQVGKVTHLSPLLVSDSLIVTPSMYDHRSHFLRLGATYQDALLPLIGCRLNCGLLDSSSTTHFLGLVNKTCGVYFRLLLASPLLDVCRVFWHVENINYS